MTSKTNRVATDALLTLGHILDHTETGRDAIHLAVVSVEAAHMLLSNQRIGLGANGKATANLPPEKKTGVVDPFLEEPVQKGERFWMVLKPRTIYSLRHVWSHPDFPDEGEAA